MSDPTFSLWVYLTRTPLMWLTVTLAAYLVADRVFQRTGRHPLANPVLHAIWIVSLLLVVTGTPYQTYFDGAQFVHFLLGPATVALAYPLYENRAIVLKALAPMLVALVAGSLTAIGSVVLLARLFGLPHDIIVALAPKSVTAPVAMGLSQSLGGDASLTVVCVLITGIFGAIVVTPLMQALRITDYRARGFAAGLACHGVGTARAFQVNPLAGAFAGLGMGINALFTSAVLPMLHHLF
ncbi:LrgB family protein [Pseudoxanthobacter sp.]|uniref:LrgB family protein n=1 Tax=Pseudoxanthobacter sp. TaxID=1925742 RepID=UPI002FE37B73